MGKLAFNVTIYIVCGMREIRGLLEVESRLPSQVTKEIENYVCAKAWHWKAGRSYCKWIICKRWRIDEKILM